MSISNLLEPTPKYRPTGSTLTFNWRISDVRYYVQSQAQISFSRESSRPNDTIVNPNGTNALGFKRQSVGTVWLVISEAIDLSTTIYTVHLLSQPIDGVGRRTIDNFTTTNVNSGAFALVAFQTQRDIAAGFNLFDSSINRVKPKRRGIIQIDAFFNVTSPGSGANMSFTFANSPTDFFGNRVYVTNIGNVPKPVHLQYIYEEDGTTPDNNNPGQFVARAYAVLALRETGSSTAAVNLSRDGVYICKYLNRYNDSLILN